MTQGYEHYKPRKWLSVSSLASFARCPMKYFLGSGCRLRTPGPTPAPLLFGEAIHAFVPYALSGDLIKGLEQFDSIWDTSLDDATHSRMSAVSMVNDLLATHKVGGLYTLSPPPQGIQDLGPRVSPWEVPWALDVGLPVPLVGRTDWLGKLSSDRQQVVPVELKTSAEVSERSMKSFSRNPQVILNVLATRHMTGEKVEKCIVEFMRKSRAGKTETIQLPVYVSDVDIRWGLEWIRDAGSRLLACEQTQTFTRNISSCTPYPMFGSHGYECEHDTLCSVEDWTTLLPAYEVGPERDFILMKLDPIKVESLT